MSLLGVDLGSSGVKGAIVDPTVGVLATAQAPVELFSPEPGWAEADPRQWWNALCIVVPLLLAGAHTDGSAIEAVAVSGMVPAVLALDRDGSPLRRAMLQNDARATLELEELSEKLAGIDFVQLTGSALTQQSLAPSILWLARHEPDLYAQTHTIAGSYDWLAMALGAERHIERNWAIESGLFDLDGNLLDTVLNQVGISADSIPPVRHPGDVVGAVSSAAAAATGLRAGTPIVVGGADHVSSAYGAGLVAAGDWLVKLGGAGDILAVSATPLVDSRLYLDAHPAGGWLPNGCMATSGSLVQWLSRVTGGATLDTLEAEAAAGPPGAHGIVCLPYFLGEKSPINDPRQRGAFVGLHLGHTRGDLYRAVTEAVAFGFRHHVDVFRERGLALERARVTNGGSRSKFWKQILADVLGTPLWPVIEHPGAALGAALSAGVGLDLCGWDAIEPLVKLDEPILPRPELANRYDELYAIYRDLEPTLRPISHRLSEGAWQ